MNEMTTYRVALVVVLGTAMLGTAAHVAAQTPEGSAARGAAGFGQCGACHSMEPGVHLTGPSLARVWGHRAGTVEGFSRYSEALKRAAVVWDRTTLDRWLENPQGVVPRNLMTFPGLKDARARADLKALGPDRRVKAIRHCGDGYHVTTEDDRTIPFWEFNLRFKTDSSPQGPPRGRPVLLSAGMQGDRVSIVFASPEEISR